MRTAIISDIHANVYALKAVLEDIEAHEVDRVICLGDVIGYGPDPIECVDLVREHCALTLLGNHDFACRTQPVNFNFMARDAALWTQDRLDLPYPDEAAREERIRFLDSLPVRRMLDDDPRFLCVHGSSRHPTNEYVFPDDGFRAERMKPLFDRFEGICFEGHTHWPGVFVCEQLSGQDPSYSFYRGLCEEGRQGSLCGGTQTGIDRMVLRLSEGTRYIINPGSVGQPRDGDSWASWSILDQPDGETDTDPTLTFHRTNYDWMRVRERIEQYRRDGDDRLDPFLGERLGMGR